MTVVLPHRFTKYRCFGESYYHGKPELNWWGWTYEPKRFWTRKRALRYNTDRERAYKDWRNECRLKDLEERQKSQPKRKPRTK